MNSSRFKIIVPKNLDNYHELANDIAEASWPQFMLQNTDVNEKLNNLFDRFGDYQFALLDTETNRMAAEANSIPFYWDKDFSELPEAGWDWLFMQAAADHNNGITPNTQAAIQIAIHPDYQNHGLSKIMIKAMHAIGKSNGFKNIVLPVRPTQKSSYPLTSIDDYVTWKTDDGLPFDPWLRFHVRARARIIKSCHQSMTVRGTRADWEKWTNIKFPQSGLYVIPGALNPMEMSVEKDEGIYIEPNVWMVNEMI